MVKFKEELKDSYRYSWLATQRGSRFCSVGRPPQLTRNAPRSTDTKRAPLN
jgi:hypothetical protein|eukprot:SAG25_NODE_373_length_8948_cov_6.275059_10_plen_51_part_00